MYTNTYLTKNRTLSDHMFSAEKYVLTRVRPLRLCKTPHEKKIGEEVHMLFLQNVVGYRPLFEYEINEIQGTKP